VNEIQTTLQEQRYSVVVVVTVIKDKKCSLSIVLTAMDQKLQKS